MNARTLDIVRCDTVLAAQCSRSLSPNSQHAVASQTPFAVTAYVRTHHHPQKAFNEDIKTHRGSELFGEPAGPKVFGTDDVPKSCVAGRCARLYVPAMQLFAVSRQKKPLGMSGF